MLGCADSIPNDKQTLTELFQYNLAHIHSVCEDFLLDDFAVMKFWYDRRKQFPNFFALAARILRLRYLQLRVNVFSLHLSYLSMKSVHA